MLLLGVEVGRLGRDYSSGSLDPASSTARSTRQSPFSQSSPHSVFQSPNPAWSQPIFLDNYKFGRPLYFEVGIFQFDVSQTDKTSAELSAMDVHAASVLTRAAASQLRDGQFPHPVLGTALLEVGQVLSTRGNVGSKSLQTGGAIYVHVETSAPQDVGRLQFQLRGLQFNNVQNLGRTSSPFFELLRKVDQPTGAKWISVYRSNVAKSTLSPIWTPAILDVEAICNGDLETSMKVIVYDHRKRGQHKVMGEFETTVQGFLHAQEDRDAMDLGFQLCKHDKRVGIVQVLEATLIGGPLAAISRHNSNVPPPPPRPEFVDYLSSGTQISLAVAIDFTAANGDPRQQGTPHYFHPPESQEWNDYEKAIFAVGSILAKYDSDQKFPVWGFGAKYNNVVRHCFQCGPEVEVEGVQGIMDAYRGVFRTPLTMSYPTMLNEVIETAASYAQHEQDNAGSECKLSYTILLILTVGNVDNIRETQATLLEVSDNPLSIVIVGIGDGDFSGIEELEKNDGRDIVKFVQFSDYKSFNALTEAVLDMIPEQLVQYFYDRDILPGKMESFEYNAVEVLPADDDDRTYTFLG